MKESSPSYFAIISADIRYCKGLESGAKLLYAEITALCNKEGFCWASNSYFAELYDVDIRTIQRWISSLIKKNFIYSEIENDGSKNPRKIYLNSSENQKMFRGRQKCQPTHDKVVMGGGDKNVMHNNTDINNTDKYHHQRSEPGEGVPEPKKDDDDDLIFTDKEREDLNNFTEHEIAEALQITKDNCRQRYNSSRVRYFLTTLRNLRKTTKTIKIKPREELTKHFKHGELYNGAECYFTDNAIAFQRGMNHKQVDFKYFSWETFGEMCNIFGIKFERHK